jgi:hypothetical protein
MKAMSQVEEIYNKIDQLLVARDMNNKVKIDALMSDVMAMLNQLHNDDIVQAMRIMSHIQFVDKELHDEISSTHHIHK